MSYEFRERDMPVWGRGIWMVARNMAEGIQAVQERLWQRVRIPSDRDRFTS